MEPGATTKGTYGAKRQSWKHAQPRQVFEKIYMSNPEASLQSLTEEFTENVIGKEKLSGRARSILEAVCIYWCANTYRALRLTVNDPVTLAKKRKAFVNQQVSKIKTAFKKKIAKWTLETLMQNGKTLGECTITEVRKMSDDNAALADALEKSGKSRTEPINNIFTDEALAKFE